MTTIAENLEQIRARMAAAATRAGRDPAGIELLAASKTVSVERLYEALKAGQSLFGENRVQEGVAKIEPVGGGARWHFIGHLQKNKVRPAVQWFDRIESVDSLALAQAVNEEAKRVGKRMPILLEMNVAGEKSKFGFPPDQLREQIAEINGLSHLEIQGLMAIPPFCEKAEDSRPYFRVLRNWREKIEREQDLSLPVLSMGMSHDFEVAIEEGATIVRVGTALFGKREAVRAHHPDAD